MLSAAVIFVAIAGVSAWAQATEIDVEHVKVYRQPGRFGGWPANHGIWSWGNEILVGFSAGHHKDRVDAVAIRAAPLIPISRHDATRRQGGE